MQQLTYFHRRTVVWHFPPAGFLLHIQQVFSSYPSEAPVFRTDHTPVRMGAFVIIIESFRPGPPSVDIIIANHIQFVQEFLRCRPRLRTDLVICLSNQTFRIQFSAYTLQMSCRQIPLRYRLIRDLITDTPYNNRRMIPVAQKHQTHIFLMAAVKPFRISPAFMGVASQLLALHDAPFVKGLIHDHQAHPVTQIQQGRIRRVM